MSKYYGKPNHLGDGAVTSLSNTELDVLVIDDNADLTDPQLNVFLDVTLGSHTGIDIKYYARYEEGGDWYELPYRNESTGVISSVPTSFTATGKLIDSLPLPGCVAFKITAVGDSASTNGAVTAYLMSRSN